MTGQHGRAGGPGGDTAPDAGPGARPLVALAMDAEWRSTALLPADLERLARIAEIRIVDLPAEPGARAENLSRMAATADAVVVSHGAPRLTAEVIAACPRLRFIGDMDGDRFTERVDVEAARSRGITVVDTTHSSSWPVAEYALALAILGLRDAGRYVRALTGRGTVPSPRGDRSRLNDRELSGRRVGLLGFGHIAWRLVELLRPFDVEVLAFDPIAPRELADAMSVTFGTMDAVISSSDVVVCLLPLTSETRGMIGERELRALRPGSVFVNVSRGAVIEPSALEAVAVQGHASFYLDVFDPEPVPDGHPLRELPNVVLSPHLAGTTREARPRFFTLMVDELERQFRGFEPHGQITPRVQAGRPGRG